jgi:hypothetical protein
LLLDGTSDNWGTKPVSFQLREGVSPEPYHSKAFPVTKIHKDTIIKEVERICKLGGLGQQPASDPKLIGSWGRRSMAVAGEVTQHG